MFTYISAQYAYNQLHRYIELKIDKMTILIKQNYVFDGQVVSGTDCSVNGFSSSPT